MRGRLRTAWAEGGGWKWVAFEGATGNKWAWIAGGCGWRGCKGVGGNGYREREPLRMSELGGQHAYGCKEVGGNWWGEGGGGDERAWMRGRLRTAWVQGIEWKLMSRGAAWMRGRLRTAWVQGIEWKLMSRGAAGDERAWMRRRVRTVWVQRSGSPDGEWLEMGGEKEPLEMSELGCADGCGAREWLEMGGEKEPLEMSELGCADGCGRRRPTKSAGRASMRINLRRHAGCAAVLQRPQGQTQQRLSSEESSWRIAAVRDTFAEMSGHKCCQVVLEMDNYYASIFLMDLNLTRLENRCSDVTKLAEHFGLLDDESSETVLQAAFLALPYLVLVVIFLQQLLRWKIRKKRPKPTQMLYVTGQGICLRCLEELDLTRTKLQELHDNAFRGLEKLKLLAMSDNELSHLSATLLRQLPLLEQLLLGGKFADGRVIVKSNRITELGAIFGHNAELQVIDLSVNGLRRIDPAAFTGLRKLRTLRLAFNRLTTIPAVQGLAQLWTLELDSNEISSIAPDAFQGLEKLQKLDLFGNEISSIAPDAFQSLAQLETLNLYWNKISSIPTDAIRGLVRLQTLNLGNNDISSIPTDAFRGLKQLQHLDLSSNEISSIPTDAIRGLVRLQHLDLGGNKISSIPTDALQSLVQLQHLDLGYNWMISSIPADAFQSLVQLQHLDLMSKGKGWGKGIQGTQGNHYHSSADGWTTGTIRRLFVGKGFGLISR
eukprot:s4829_g3.t1